MPRQTARKLMVIGHPFRVSLRERGAWSSREIYQGWRCVTMTEMKKLLVAVLFSCAMVWAQSPTTVIHIINVKWKEDASPEKIQAALDGAHQLPSKFPGI